MNAAVARWLETIRQRALVRSLGQVVCKSRWHDFGIIIARRCPDCRATL